MRTPQGAKSASPAVAAATSGLFGLTGRAGLLGAIGLVGALAGLASVLSSTPTLGLLAGFAAAAVGGLAVFGGRSAGSASSASSVSASASAIARSSSGAEPDADELAEELALAKVREVALQERIAMLENAARAAATASLVGLAPAPGSTSASTTTGAVAPSNTPVSTAPAGIDASQPADVESLGAPVPLPGAAKPTGPLSFPSLARIGNGSALLTDGATGLFSESYFEVALEARIAAARRRLRPVALVLLDVVDGAAGGDGSKADAAAVTHALRRTLREADTACRLDDGRFALVLEDTPENGAIWTVERVRSHLSEGGARCTVWAGVACYPAHAFDKEEILKQAETALVQAKEWRQDRIEVAQAE